MMKQKTLLLTAAIISLSVTLAWALPPFQQTIRDLRSDSKIAHAQAIDMNSLADRIRQVSLEIKNLSEATTYKDQRDKVRRLEDQADLLLRLVGDLTVQADDLKKLAQVMQDETRRLSRIAMPAGPSAKGCGPGEVWIPRQKSPNGKWIPGHCARTY